MIAGLYTMVDIVDRIERYFQARSPEHFYLSTMFCYFAPEIKQINQELFSSIFTLFENEMQLMSAPTILYEVYVAWSELSENNFELYFKSFEQEHLIKNDSIEQLIPIISDINFRLKPSIFGLPPFLQNRPTLIECAAFYGSIKCFKYLLLNKADLSLKDNISRTLVDFAIAGGNLEIVRILDQNNLNFADSLKIATSFHRHDVFLWLIENEKCIMDGETLCHAAIKANLEDLLYMFDNNIDPNLPNRQGWSAIHYASNHCVISSLKLLLSHNQIDPNIDNNGNSPPLDEAVSNGRYVSVELLISDSKVDINKRNKDGITL